MKLHEQTAEIPQAEKCTEQNNQRQTYNWLNWVQTQAESQQEQRTGWKVAPENGCSGSSAYKEGV